MEIIRLENVSFTYSQGTSFAKQALKNVSFSIEEGSFVGLIGHTGSGKSTLIQHLNGLMKATEGKIYLHGQDIDGHDFERRTLCHKVGLVFQYPEYQLFEETILKDVCFGPQNLGLDADETDRRAREALRLVGISEDYYEKSPFDLSGGEKRRVAIAGVIAMQPEVLILDEPAAGLDPEGKRDILEMIYGLHRETGMTVLLSSHSMEDMARYADRLIVMNQGEIVRDGTPECVFTDYEYLESIGLRAPEMVYFMHRLKALGFDVNENALTVNEAEQEILGLWRAKKSAKADCAEGLDFGGAGK